MQDETSHSVEERMPSLFQPDILLPVQYFENLRSRAHLEPEKSLMLSVLEDGIACFQRYIFSLDSRGKSLFREAEEWINEENSDWLFSFESICEVLGFNPKYVRHGLLRWKERKFAEHHKAKIYHLLRSSLVRCHQATEGRVLESAGTGT